MELTKEQLSSIYDILVKECEALPNYKTHFVTVMSNPRIHKYRFEGCLGFGGKLNNAGDKVYVSCYKEDRDRKRAGAIRRTNNRLNGFLKKEGLIRNQTLGYIDVIKNS